jgi:probable phosphoglycerate mutase
VRVHLRGRAQAQAVAELLASDPVDVVYSSPLRRALDTARPLAERHGADLRVRDELREIHYGDYQGLLKTERNLRIRHTHRYDPMPGGESLHDVYRRVERLHGSELVGELRAGRTVAAVGHFWSNRMLVGLMAGVPFDDLFAKSPYKPENGSVWRLELVADGDGPLQVHEARWA